MATWIVVTISGLAIILALFSGVRAKLVQSNEGKVMAFLGLLVLPTVSVWFGFEEQMTGPNLPSFACPATLCTTSGRVFWWTTQAIFPRITTKTI